MPHELDEQQVRFLLAIAMAYDNRKPGTAQIAAWTEASARGRWSFDEACEAIHQHFAESTDYLMPGHITLRIRDNRQRPKPYAALPASPGIPAAPERVREIVKSLAVRLGWRDSAAADDVALRVPCPYCASPVGRRCARQLARGHRRGQWVPISASHRSRLELAKRTTHEEHNDQAGN